MYYVSYRPVFRFDWVLLNPQPLPPRSFLGYVR